MMSYSRKEEYQRIAMFKQARELKLNKWNLK